MDETAESPVQSHLAAIEADMHTLQRQLHALSARVTALESGGASPIRGTGESPAAPVPEAKSWLAHSAALRRVATISFVLVFALVLRTLTDSGVVGPNLGVWLGVSYAFLLVGIGWSQLSRGRAGKRVFPVCGAVLLSALALEAHARFGHLDGTAAHGLLIVLLLVSAALGRAYRTPVVAEAGTLAPTLAAIAMHFPMPQFHVVAAMLVLAAVVAGAVADLRRAAWLHWPVAVLQLFFWSLWSTKLAVPLIRGEALAPDLQLEWFLPTLAVQCTALLVVAWLRCRTRPTPFWLILPTANVAGGLAAAAAVVLPWFGPERALGGIALAVAALHVWLATRARRAAVVVVTAMALGATTAFVPGVALVTGTLWLALPLWALAALVLAVSAIRLGSAGLRVAAWILQLGTAGAAIAAGVFAAPPAAPWAAAALAAVLAAVAGLHYARATRSAPPADSWYARVSPTDRPAVVLLWAAIAALFCGLRVLAHPAVAALATDVDNAFGGAQSVLLNTIATALLVAAHLRTSRTLLGTAVLVGLVGGVKTLASDLLNLQGVPLVASVFSFGITALVGSLVLGRWQRTGDAAAA